MGRVTKSLLVGAVCLILLAVGFAVWMESRYSAVVQTNFGVSLPITYREIYEGDMGASPHGDGYRYHVLQYGRHADLEKAAEWQASAPEAWAESRQWMDALAVPPDKRPKESDCLAATVSRNGGLDILHLFWDADTGILYLAEQHL